MSAQFYKSILINISGCLCNHMCCKHIFDKNIDILSKLLKISINRIIKAEKVSELILSTDLICSKCYEYCGHEDLLDKLINVREWNRFRCEECMKKDIEADVDNQQIYWTMQLFAEERIAIEEAISLLFKFQALNSICTYDSDERYNNIHKELAALSNQLHTLYININNCSMLEYDALVSLVNKDKLIGLIELFLN